MSNHNRTFMCCICGYLFRYANSPETIPKHCNQTMIPLTYEQAYAAIHLKQHKRIDWYKKGGHILRNSKRGKKKWIAAIHERDIQDSKQQFNDYKINKAKHNEILNNNQFIERKSESFKKIFPLLDEEIIPFILQENGLDKLSEYRDILINLSSTHYSVKNEGIDNLMYQMLFDSSDIESDYPDKSVWAIADLEYRPNILEGNLGDGVILGLCSNNYSIEKLLVGISSLTITNCIINIIFAEKGKGSSYIVIDIKELSSSPTSVKKAINLKEKKKEFRLQFMNSLFSLIGLQGDIILDFVYNDIILCHSSIMYLKGVCDTKKTLNHGIFKSFNSQLLYIYRQIPDYLNGFMECSYQDFFDDSKVIETFKPLGFDSGNIIRFQLFDQKDEKFIRQDKYYFNITYPSTYLFPKIVIQLIPRDIL